MIFPVPPPDLDAAAAPTVQVWRTERPAATEAPPIKALPERAAASNLPPCDSPNKQVTPATAPIVQVWRISARTPASPPPPVPCRPPQGASAGSSGARPARINAVSRQRLAPAIRQAAAAYRLEPELLHAVISAESGYDPAARSPKGARGLMQLMPATARRFGVADPDEPVANLRGGAEYLRWLLDLFADLPLALAGYNAGENAVIRYGNSVPPYPETQTYVRRVLEYYRQYRRTPFL